MTTRIYAVTDGDTDEKYLVRASTTAPAIAHVSKRFGAAVATQEQLVRWLDEGVEVETYRAAKQAELLP
ncbi:hypothetical protein CS053_08590 [Rhodanobacter glycinis]|uniref:Uncharacterized protein n=1 Tax=Rhodanobacter glycinis TaxID=582702 RepID=A0A5B9DZA3_9GAMM|nr:hypothetical protein [Rhodanobacter glycinis]QEE24554.1 hypothetical protein CS053_08590 [Rhodanobacter glycinis]